MSDLEKALAGTRAATSEFLAASDRSGASWRRPPAPGKWSPSQIAEHVGRIMEESARVASGDPSDFPSLPFFVRPIVRVLVFQRILNRNAFLKMKAAAEMSPSSGSDTPAQARVRLEETLDRFDEACRARAASRQDVKSTIFGSVPVADFARFQELHIRHHRVQITRVAKSAGGPDH